jgi:7-carboxy-7-deazaguanine synthase
MGKRPPGPQDSRNAAATPHRTPGRVRAREPLRICERFRSLQGETTHAGRPASFVRLSGCNLRCAWCDSAYAWDGGVLVPGEVVALDLAAWPDDLVVITGGEPLLQPAVLPLLRDLVDRGRTVLLETNGSLDLRPVPPGVRRILDLKCPGSGAASTNRWANLRLLGEGDEVKLVIADHADFTWAMDVVRRHRLADRCPVLLSPAGGQMRPRDLAAWILAEPDAPVRLQLQLHQVIWPRRRRGV